MYKKIITVDAALPAGGIQAESIAYYRITQDMVNFLKQCDYKHDIIGFEYEEDSMNFGVILAKKKHG